MLPMSQIWIWRIISLISSSMIMLTAGTIYVFSMYGPQLSKALNLSQSQTAFIASCSNSGMLLTGPIMGHLVDKYPKQPWKFLLLGGSLICIGYSLAALSYLGWVPHHFLLVAIYFLCIGVGSSSSYHSALATNYRNWPADYRGIAVGFPVAYFGLSALLYSLIAKYFFRTSEENGVKMLNVPEVLFFVGGSALLINAVGALFLRDIGSIEENETNVVEPQEPEAPVEVEASTSRQVSTPQLRISVSSDNQRRSSEQVERTPLLASLRTNRLSYMLADTTSEERALENEEAFSASCDLDLLHHDPSPIPPHIQLEDTSCLHYSESYILAYCMFAIVGVGLMYINNVGSMIRSIGAIETPVPKEEAIEHTQNLHVMVLSGSGFVCRIFAGLFSDAFGRIGIPRSFLLLIFGSLVLSGLMYSIYITHTAQLLVSTILLGLGYGGVWSIIPILTGEYFGFRSFASNWGWLTVLPGIGGQVTNLLFGMVYDHHAREGKCHGTICFIRSMEIGVLFVGVGILLISLLVLKRTIQGLVVWRRTLVARDVYQAIE